MTNRCIVCLRVTHCAQVFAGTLVHVGIVLTDNREFSRRPLRLGTQTTIEHLYFIVPLITMAIVKRGVIVSQYYTDQVLSSLC